MRALLDTNVIVSYLLTPQNTGTIYTIIKAFEERQFTLLLPQELADEINRVVSNRPHLVQRIPPVRLNRFRRQLSSLAEIIEPIEQAFPRITRDRKDDYLIAYAVVGEADYLVTGDKDLLVLERVADVVIITPFQFAALLASQPPPDN